MIVIAAAVLVTMRVQSKTPTLKNVHTLVCMGASITQLASGPEGYVTLLQKALPDVRVINAGVSGNKSPDMRRRFQRDVLDKNPDLVTINVGNNDVWHSFDDKHPHGDGPNGNPLEIYRQDVQAMLDMAKAKHVTVVLLSPEVIYEDSKNEQNRKLEIYNKALKEIADRNGVKYLDLHRPFLQVIDAYQKRAGKGVNLLTVDGVHMNAAGYRLMATLILDGLGFQARK